jgi:hypothetical protein
MRRICLSASTLAAATLLAFPAAAQQTRAPASQAAGMRTLSWPGMTRVSTPAPVSAAAPARQADTPAPSPTPAPLVRTETRYSGAPAVAPRANGLTPASAFYAAPAPVYQPVSAPQPYQPQPYQPQAYQAPAPQPATEPAPQAQPQPAPATDPMAPRANAPIFRMQSAAAAPRPVPQAPAPSAAPSAAPRAEPDQLGARYYSVHRAAGRTPDPTTLPAPFFLDSAPVDLAEPPPPPAQVRQGGLNPAVADMPGLP